MMKDFENMKVEELKSLAKEASIKGYGSMNKKNLINALKENSEVKSTTISDEAVATEIPEDILEKEESDSEEKHVGSVPATDEEYMNYLKYKDRIRPLSEKEVNWKGNIRIRYECPMCAVKIGNPEDHFCYNCGQRLKGDEKYPQATLDLDEE